MFRRQTYFLSFLYYMLTMTTVVTSINTYYMDACARRGSTLYFKEPVIVELTAESEYDPEMACELTLNSAGTYMDRIMIRVLSLDVEGEFYSCLYDRLMIYDGPTKYSGKLTESQGLCGNNAPDTVYRSTYSQVDLTFTSDATVQHTGFKLLITGFDDSGFCTFSEYECDNGDCVDVDAECDGYQNCMAGSDEDFCDLSVGAISGITVGCVAGAIVLAGVVIALASRNRRARVQGARAVTERSSLTCNAQPYSVSGQVPGTFMAPPPYATLYPPQYASVNALPVNVQNPRMAPNVNKA